MALMSVEELPKYRYPSLQKGLLLEFKKKGSHTKLLAVAERPHGNNKWTVSDQNGVSFPIKLRQVTYIVPGIDNFDPTNIADFAQKAEDNLDPALLELAWIELLLKNKTVTVEELAEMIFGCAEPLGCYSAHLLLSKDELYFTKLSSAYYSFIYEPRSIEEVEEIKCRKLEKEAEEKELLKFVELLNSVKSMPCENKRPKSSWMSEEKIWNKIHSLEAYAIESTEVIDEQSKTIAMNILKAMDMKETPYSAVNLLIDIGYLPVHFNVQLVRMRIPTVHSPETISAANVLLSEPSDPDQKIRKDLTHLQTYAIDVNEASELDDALSAIRLHNGGFQIWIHIADPTLYVQPGSLVDREAMRRWASVFLPTATYPMFPEELAMKGMSMKQGEICTTITVSAVLHNDGSIAECSVENSVIELTHAMTYDEASKLLQLNLDANNELRILSEAASLRLNWRLQQGALDATTIEARVRVAMANPEDAEPAIEVYVEDQASPGTRIVSEMMILCGEAIGKIGSHNGIPLPYRGQTATKRASEFAHLPEGPVRRMFMITGMEPAQLSYRNPQPHVSLGLSAYVQFSSPIRRYNDLLAHYQIKAFLRGQTPPFAAPELEDIVRREKGEEKGKVAKNLKRNSHRYWLLEYLRRQPQKIYNALILRVFRNYKATILLRQVALETAIRVSSGFRKGNEIEIEVEEVNPRDNLLLLKVIRKL